MADILYVLIFYHYHHHAHYIYMYWQKASHRMLLVSNVTYPIRLHEKFVTMEIITIVKLSSCDDFDLWYNSPQGSRGGVGAHDGVTGDLGCTPDKN